MSLAEVRKFVADELLEMAKYMETGFLFGKLELLLDQLDRYEADAKELVAETEDPDGRSQLELVSLFRSHLDTWQTVPEDAVDAQSSRRTILQSLRDGFVEWSHKNYSPTLISREDAEDASSDRDGESDERRRQLNRILRACQVKDYKGLYVLGSFDVKKTINTQQRRAFALVNALAEFGRLPSGVKIAVVGGGIGGLSLAIGCSMVGGKVTIFEENTDLLHYQRGNTQRFLHPNIFDWPQLGSLDRKTRLPYLNWSKGTSSNVAEEILLAYEALKPKITERGGEIIERTGEGYLVQDVEQSEGTGDQLQIVGDTPKCSGSFDIVLIAVGFGLENTSLRKFGTPFYWHNDKLDQTIGFGPDNKERILISGTGDGALLDVIRASLQEFAHSKVEETFSFLLNDELKKELLKIERLAENNFEQTGSMAFDFYQRYRACLENIIGLDLVAEECLKGANENRDVTLNYRQAGVFSLGTSPLNRLVATALEVSGVVRFQRGHLAEDMVSNDDGKFSVLWNNRSSQASVYHQLIVRHGPDPDYFHRRFPEIWKKVIERQPQIGMLQVTTNLDDKLVFPVE